MAPHLKSMTINLRPLLWYGPIASLLYPLVCRNRWNQKPGTPRPDGQIACSSQQEESPSIQQLQIVNMQGRLKHDYPCDSNENMVLPLMIFSPTQPHTSPYRCYISATGELFDQALSTPSTLIRKTARLFSGNCLRWSRKSREKPELSINTNHASRILLEILLWQNINDLKGSLWMSLARWLVFPITIQI